MTYIEHANRVLDHLASRRGPDLRILPLTNTELLKATTQANPSDYAVVYGQVNSLLEMASMEADLPLIGRLITFDHKDSRSGPWADWLQFESLLFHSAPRLKAWSDSDISLIRSQLKPGTPSEIWKVMETDSAMWLNRVLSSAQKAIQAHVDQYQTYQSANI